MSDLDNENIKQLFENLTIRYEKANTINVGYDIGSGENVIYKKAMITQKEYDFMQNYLKGV